MTHRENPIGSTGRRKIVLFTAEQIRTLMSVAHHHHLETLLTLALATGMRRGELLGLQWEDIDFEQELLHVRHSLMSGSQELGQSLLAVPKTAMSKRRIVLMPLALEALKTYREDQYRMKVQLGSAWVDNGLVFCTSQGSPLHVNRDILKPFKCLLQEACLPTIPFHNLRHCTTALLLYLQVHPNVVQAILGFATSQTVIALDETNLFALQKDAMKKLNDLLCQWDDEAERKEEL